VIRLKQKELSNYLKALFALAFLCCAAAAFWLVPMLGERASELKPEHAELVMPCLIFFWVTLIPVIWSLCLAWKISDEIGKDNSFCHLNAVRLRTVSRLAVLDTVLYLIAAVVLTAAGAVEVLGLAAFAAVLILGIALAVGMAALSHLIEKAAALKDDADLTI